MERVVCPGPIRSGPLTFGRTRKGVRNSLAIPLLSLAAPSRGQFFLRLLFFSPVNGPVNSFRLVWSFAISSCNWFRMYSLIVSSYFQLSPCSSLYTRNVGSHICILNAQVDRISSNCSFHIPYCLTHSNAKVSLLTYGFFLDSIPLL